MGLKRLVNFKLKNILKLQCPLIIVIIVGSMTFYFYKPLLVKGFIYLANGYLVNGKIVESKKNDKNEPTAAVKFEYKGVLNTN